MEVMGKISNLPGCLNSIKWSNHGRNAQMLGSFTSGISLAVSHSKEERLGRWHVQKGIQTGISILRHRETIA